nr:stress response protein nst1-like [Quercus suber]
MATNAKFAAQPPMLASDGTTTSLPKGVPGANRKKQKRRAKQAQKAAQQAPPSRHAGERQAEVDFDEDPLGYGEDDYEYSDAEPDRYHDQYIPPHAETNGYHEAHPPAKKRNKKKGAGPHHQHSAYHPDMLPPLPNPPHSSAMRNMHHKGHNHANIWNTSTQQERQNIKDFWLSLSEDERKSLLKIEKEAVLRKMKQQQKHSCSCTVCGRKRTAIEEELEVLYEGYYEELEQYAHHDTPPLATADGLVPDGLQRRIAPNPLAVPPPNPTLNKPSRLREHLEEEEEEDYSEDEEYSDDEEEEEYSDEEPVPIRPGVPDFFNFGQNLTVKGILTPWLEKLQDGLKGKADNLLTVADDLLKNDGRKFIEMMEQLAERRMQRENEAEYAAANPRHPDSYRTNDTTYDPDDSVAANDEYDDDEASYDSQEDYDDDIEEDDNMVSANKRGSLYVVGTDRPQGELSEEQRMQEGRRMFQIFAARMFEQRVLTAYREKVAAERQQKLLEELEEEGKLETQREAKKQRDAQKKKDKKKQQQAIKAEEKARKDAEKAAEEARLREAEEKKAEETRRKREEQRKKKEEEKRKQDEERAKKEAEKARRLQEQQQQREEAERKARETKAAEKAKKDETRKREKEEREAKEKEAKERKNQEERERKEREAKIKAETEARQREKGSQQPGTQPQQITKRPSQPGMVAVPGLFPKQTSAGIASPHSSIATPAVMKASAPAKQRQISHHGSHASSPKQINSQVPSVPSKSSSPGNASASQQPPAPPKTILQKPGNQQVPPMHPMQTASPLHHLPMQPPPGVHPQQHHGGFGNVPGMGFPGFQGPPGPMIPGNIGQRGSMPAYPHHQGPPIGMTSRAGFGPPGAMNGMVPPPGMVQQGRGIPFFDAAPHGQQHSSFGQTSIPNQTSPLAHPPPQGPTSVESTRAASVHSRQPSTSEKERFESAANHPIARPPVAPIQRPGSVKSHSLDDKGSDIEDLSNQLGSSALLADDDEPLPSHPGDNRRHSNMAPGARRIQQPNLSSVGPSFGAQPIGFGTPGPNWATPGLPFGQSPGLGQQPWGSLPTPGMSGWAQSNTAFSSNGAFGGIGGASMHRPSGAGINRPLTIRLAVCTACKQLSNAMRGEGDGYHDMNILLRQIEMNRPMLESLPTLREVEEICETEGDSQNGGGELYLRRGESDNHIAVKWEPDAATPDQNRGHVGGLGEIGSPMPSKTSPVGGFGAPGMGRAPGGFQSLGAVGTGTGF